MKEKSSFLVNFSPKDLPNYFKFMKLQSTDECKQFLSDHYGLAVNGWKRVSKSGDKKESTRIFTHKDSKFRYQVITVGDYFFSVSPIVELPVFTTEELKKAAKGIKHCGDYCHFYFNRKLGELYISMGDGDCAGEEENGTSTYEEIVEMVKDLKGVKTITVEAECNPDTDSGEWVRIEGTFGTT